MCARTTCTEKIYGLAMRFADGFARELDARPVSS